MTCPLALAFPLIVLPLAAGGCALAGRAGGAAAPGHVPPTRRPRQGAISENAGSMILTRLR